MGMDAFTSTCLTKGTEVSSIDGVADLDKELRREEGGPSEEAVAFFNEHVGKRCGISDTNLFGVIESLNEATSGFYPGSRYPINVRMADGSLFEYDISNISFPE